MKSMALKTARGFVATLLFLSVSAFAHQVRCHGDYIDESGKDIKVNRILALNEDKEQVILQVRNATYTVLVGQQATKEHHIQITITKNGIQDISASSLFDHGVAFDVNTKNVDGDLHLQCERVN